MEMYPVGGCVRDEILGVKSKDIDFVVVMPEVEGDPFLAMCNRLRMQGFSLFKETEKPEFVTVRGIFPRDHEKYPGKPADFVLARKESGYSDGRHPDKVEIGTLQDDLNRRDFTMNAIAKAETVYGEPHFIDPHEGVRDIERRLIRAVGDPLERLSEDPLRALRALRFSVTKGFTIERSLQIAMSEKVVLDGVRNNVSDERIGDELSKMLRHNSLASLSIFSRYSALIEAALSGKVSLDSTLKTKGRGDKVSPSQKKPSDKPAYNGCQCICHREKGIMHMSACCRP